MEKETKKGNTAFKRGSYSLGISALVIAVVIVFNLILTQVPSDLLQFDISGNNLYEITDVSRELLSGLDKNVDMTVLAEKDSVDDRIVTFIEKYSSLSDKIKVEYIDPVLHPSILTEYSTEAKNIVVKCKDTDKSSIVPFDKILVSDEYAYYYGGSTSPTKFDAEGQLTSAVNTVVADKNKLMYQCTDHGEGTFSNSVSDLMSKSNITLKSLELLVSNKIPDDCDILMLNAPTKDLSKDECKLITEYVKGGGKVFVVLNDEVKDGLANLYGVLEEYGMQVQKGYAVDMERNYQGNYYYIFPEITGADAMVKGMTTNMVLIPYALGIKEVDPARESITETNFMTTSENAYMLVGQDDATQGKFAIGAYAVESDGESETSKGQGENSESNNSSGRFTVIAGKNMISEDITSLSSSIENLTIFMNAITSNFDDVANISIEPKSLEVTYNTVSRPGMFNFIAIFCLPVLILVGGFIYWTGRRKA